MSTTVGTRLRDARLAATLSARELSRLADRPETQCALIEARDQVVIDPDVAASYCNVLGISRAWLVLGEGAPPADETIRAAVVAARAKRDQSPTEAA